MCSPTHARNATKSLESIPRYARPLDQVIETTKLIVLCSICLQDLSYKEKHWHEACFLCNKCRLSLVDKQFGSKADKIYCGNCYDTQFASRCDGCGEIFRAGKYQTHKTVSMRLCTSSPRSTLWDGVPTNRRHLMDDWHAQCEHDVMHGYCGSR